MILKNLKAAGLSLALSLALAACAQDGSNPLNISVPEVDLGFDFGIGGGSSLPPADDTVIVYGGIAYVDKRAQPLMDEILYGRGGQPSEMVLGLQRQIVGKKIADGFSTWPVVDDPEELRAIVADKNALDVNAVRGQALENELAGSKILVLSLIGGLEFDFNVPKATTLGNLVDRVSLVTVSAVLSRPGTGEILLSTQATTQRLARGGTTEDLGDLYLDAGRRAVDNLRTAAARFDPDAPSAMVTGVVLQGQQASRTFEFTPNGLDEGSNPCAVQLRCPVDTAGRETSCRKLQSAMANLTTEALGAKGLNMLPPRDFAIWAEISDVGTNIGTLSFSTTGGWYARDQKVALLIEPDKADEKYVVALRELTQSIEPGTGTYVHGIRFDADLQLLKFGGGACRTATPMGAISPFRGDASLTCNYPTSVERIDGPVAQLYGIAAIRKGLDLGGEASSGARCQ